MDRQAKHYRQMKNAVWLYLYLLLNANRRTGLLKKKIQTMSGDMGVNRDTVMRWLNVLRSKGYIVTVNTGRSLTIEVQRWKPIVRIAKIQPQLSALFNSRSGKYPTAGNRGDRTTSLRRDRTSAGSSGAKERPITILLPNDMRGTLHAIPFPKNSNGTEPWALRERFAQELAQALDDTANINRYRAYCWRYPEELLRKVLGQVLGMPAGEIAKGRDVLFTQLLQQHAKGTTENPGS